MGTHPIFESDFDCLTDFLNNSDNMVFNKFIEIGGIIYSEKAAKPAAVVNVIGLNRLLVDDGNCGRFEVNCRDIKLTDLKVKISWGARPGTVKKAWAAANMNDEWAKNSIANGMATKARRANLNDFEPTSSCVCARRATASSTPSSPSSRSKSRERA